MLLAFFFYIFTIFTLTVKAFKNADGEAIESKNKKTDSETAIRQTQATDSEKAFSKKGATNKSDRKDPITYTKHYTTAKGFCPHQISTKIGDSLYKRGDRGAGLFAEIGTVYIK